MEGFKKLVWMLLILLGLNDGINELLLFEDGDDELLLLLDLLFMVLLDLLLFGFEGEDLKYCEFFLYINDKWKKLNVVKYFLY